MKQEKTKLRARAAGRYWLMREEFSAGPAGSMR
jgi:hypothetical protein